MSSCKKCRECRQYLKGSFRDNEHICRQVDFRLLELAFGGEHGSVSLDKVLSLKKTVEAQHDLVKADVLDGRLLLPDDLEAFSGFLCMLHRRIFPSDRFWYGGRLRQVGEPTVYFGHGRHQREGAAPGDIERKLRSLFMRVELDAFYPDDDDAFLRACAKFLEEFFRIHPFHDGNGRVGRLVLDAMAYKAQYAFKQVVGPGMSRRRQRYWRALSYARRAIENEYRSDPYEFLMQWLRKGLHRLTSVEDELLPPSWIKNGENLRSRKTLWLRPRL